MPNEYGNHAEYMKWVKGGAIDRYGKIEHDLREAFSDFIEIREVEVIAFSKLKPVDLANAIYSYPRILKPLLAICNIAARAIERDLSIRNLDTYNPKITEENSKIIAGYTTPFLPPFIEIPAILFVDKIEFIDKEIRKAKGNWEKEILININKYSNYKFAKKKFVIANEEFELDAAAMRNDVIIFGIDIKRIEARRDIHKRCDEIVNKSVRLKEAFPESKFAAVIYYPFVEEHSNVKSRLGATSIDTVVFASAGKESIINAVRLLVSSLGASK
jgi:hypothetical protein